MNLKLFAIIISSIFFVVVLTQQCKTFETTTIYPPGFFERLDTLAEPVTLHSVESEYVAALVTELPPKHTLAYINRFTATAQAEMQKFGIPASVKMAQALIESRSGQSRLAINNNNHFGMKCFSRHCYKGHCTNATDDHHKDFFRKYPTAWESWRAHSILISQGRYAKLRDECKDDYKKWARGLKEAGYATDKGYDKKLIDTIEKYKLYQLDKLGQDYTFN